MVNSKDLNQLVTKLNELELNQVFVEAGPTLASAMIKASLIDEVIIYQAPTLLGSGKTFYINELNSSINDQLRLEHISTQVLAGDLKSTYLIGSNR